jgi:hypothetical protein
MNWPGTLEIAVLLWIAMALRHTKVYTKCTCRYTPRPSGADAVEDDWDYGSR